MVDVFTTKPLRDLDTLSDQKVIFDLLFFKIVTCAFLVIDKKLGVRNQVIREIERKELIV